MENQKYLRVFFEGNRLNFAAAVLLWLLSALATPFASWLIGAITDCMAEGDMSGLLRIVGITAVLLPAITLVSFLADRVNDRFLHRASSQYKTLAFLEISQKGICAFSKENSARYLSALTNDVNAIEQQYLEKLVLLVYEVFGFAVALGMMLYYSPVLTAVVMVGSTLPILAAVLMGNRYARLEKRVSDANERFTGRVKDLLHGFALIKSFKAEKESQTLFQSANASLEAEKKAKRDYAAVLKATTSSAGMLLQIGIFVAGAAMALMGQITPGTVLMFVNLVNVVLSPIRNVPSYLAGRKAALALVDKFRQNVNEKITEEGECIEPKLDDAIVFDHVAFAYEDGKAVLQDVSLRLEAGKKYAIVGGSGAGKTTLLNLLMGAYTGYSGSITIDGKELSAVAPDSLYDVMSLIGQNVFLFDDTIRQNITMFRDFPDDAVRSAVQRSGLSRLIRERGEDYRCGEGGSGLSGGERQRVSIARCLLRKTPVLLMDEVTASLDAKTAFEVSDEILKLGGLTRVAVTHRLDPVLLKQYDTIIVLRDGRVDELGSFEDLMERKGYFYSLFNISRA